MVKKEEKVETPEVQVEEPVASPEEQYEANVKVVARDLVKASVDLAVAFEKKPSDALQDIADYVTKLTE